MSLTYELANLPPNSGTLVATNGSSDKNIFDPKQLWRSYNENAIISDTERALLSRSMAVMAEAQEMEMEDEVKKLSHWLHQVLEDDDNTRYQVIRALSENQSLFLSCLAIYNAYTKRGSEGQSSEAREDTISLLHRLIVSNIEPAESLSTLPSKATKKTQRKKTPKFNAKAKLEAWSSMPVDELQERLNKGEQLHIEEWMPNNGTRRPLLEHEIKEHLQFAEEIKGKANEAYMEYTNLQTAIAQGDGCDSDVGRRAQASLDRCILLYSQGVSFAEWVCSAKDNENHNTLQWEMEQVENTFHRNFAIANYHNGTYNKALTGCNFVLERDPSDHKARYRRGLCYTRQSSVKEAKDDFMILLKTPDDIDAQAAGRHGLRELRSILIEWKADARQFMSNGFSDEIFSSNRMPTSPANLSSTRPPLVPSRVSVNLNIHQEIKSQTTSLSCLASSLPPRDDPRRLDYDTILSLLLDLLDYYNRKEVVDSMNTLRLECDFDAVRYLRRFRKDVLPDLMSFVFLPALSSEVHDVEDLLGLNRMFRAAVLHLIAQEKLDHLTLVSNELVSMYMAHFSTTDLANDDTNQRQRIESEWVEKEQSLTRRALKEHGPINALWHCVHTLFWGDINAIDD